MRGPHRSLGLSSASLFRNEEGSFRRLPISEGWSEATVEMLDAGDSMLAPLATGRPFGIDASEARRNRLPLGLAQPVLAVPVADRFRCFALALYGPHASGNDLAHDERTMLAGVADKAAAILAKLESDTLRRRIAELEHELAKAGTRIA